MKNESIAQMRSSIEIIEEQNAELKDKVNLFECFLNSKVTVC
jgi:hypothetical protein